MRYQIRLKAEILKGRIDLLATDVLSYETEDFHLDILGLARDLYELHGEGLLLAPRGFGKSTMGTVTLCIWLILINPNIRILINSSTAAKAEAFLREIKTHFEQNDKLKVLFGEQFNPNAWRNADVSVMQRTRIAKEGTLSAHGQSGAVVSKHYDVHIVDDPVNEDSARTKGQREKLKDWFYMSLDPTLEPHGFRLIIGTRYNPDDLYGHMIEREKEEAKREDDFPQDMGKNLRPFKVKILQAIIDEDRPTERSLWPKKFPLQILKKKKRDMGSIRFNAQFQNQTDLMKGKIIKQQYFEYYRPSELDVSTLKIVMGVDLNAGKNSNNDFFALVTKGYDSLNGKAYTLDVVHGRYSFNEQMIVILWKAGRTLPEIQKILHIPGLKITDIMQLFKGQHRSAKRQYKQVARIGVEAVIYQRVLPDTLKEYDIGLPVVRIDQSVDKETRIVKYSPRFENGMEYFPDDDSVNALIDEMLLFPDGSNDDLVDGHEIAHRVAAQVFALEELGDDSDIQVRVIG